LKEEGNTNLFSYFTKTSFNPFTAAPFFGEKHDFEINAQKILE
jgi:hypothetical protein